MILKPTPAHITKAAILLKGGDLVSFPTETVYGLGADATNEEAVRKIFTVKGRPSYDPLIVHVADPDAIEEFVDLSDDSIRERFDLLKVLWPGPLSIILPLILPLKGKAKNKAKNKIAPSVTAGLKTVAFRIPSHPVALDLLREVGLPIAAPSANQFSYVSPTKAQHVYDSLGDKVSIILDGGSCSVGIESTVLSICNKQPMLLRPGAVTKVELENLIGDIIYFAPDKSRSQKIDGTTSLPTPLPSPGMLDKHYSPKTKLLLKSDVNIDEMPNRVGLISFSNDTDLKSSKIITTKTLTISSSLEEIATSLYEAIRDLDKLGLDLILIDSCSDVGLGQAIMDRITRAVHKF